MRLISWKSTASAPARQGVFGSVTALDADVICRRSFKAREVQVEIQLPAIPGGLSAVKPGYSGTACSPGYPSVSRAFRHGLDDTTSRAG